MVVEGDDAGVSRTRLFLASLLLGAIAASTVATGAEPPASVPTAPVAATAPAAVPTTSAVARPPTTPTAARPTARRPTATSAPRTTTSRATTRTAAQCERIGNESTMPNADLYPYLRSIGCGRWLDAGIRAAEQQYGPGAHSSGPSAGRPCTSVDDPPASCPNGYASNVGDRGADLSGSGS